MLNSANPGGEKLAVINSVMEEFYLKAEEKGVEFSSVIHIGDIGDLYENVSSEEFASLLKDKLSEGLSECERNNESSLILKISGEGIEINHKKLIIKN